MRLHDHPARLRRGAAPAGERTSLLCVGIAAGAHAALLLLFVTWAKPPIDVALPGSSGAPPPPPRLVRLSPLRTFPPAESSPAEPERERPKPALVKRYTPGAPIVPKHEKGAARK